MGFLKNFFTDVYANETKARPATGFQQLSEVELEAHLNVARYGDFELTDAVRPSYTLEVVPSAGYRHDTYRDEENRAEVPVLMAAVTRPYMMDAFMSLIEQLGDVVDVVLETSHGNESHGHTDLYREHIDMPILQSTLWDFEDLFDERRLHRHRRPQPAPAARSPARRAQAPDRLRQRPARLRKHPRDEHASPAATTCGSSPKPSTSTPPASATSTSSKN